jgi:hypothetical protein
MARFRATIAGNRGEASRLGTASSGLSVTANGWHGGVSVEVRACECGGDTFTARATGGSGYAGAPVDKSFEFCSSKGHAKFMRAQQRARREAARAAAGMPYSGPDVAGA